MGRISKNFTLENVKIPVKRNSGDSPCSAELVSFITCLDLNGGDEGKCSTAKTALGSCMELSARSGWQRRTHKAPINFHLQRVSQRE